MILHNYLSNSGRDLIYEYINSLPEAEKIDGYTVLHPQEVPAPCDPQDSVRLL